MEKDEIKTLVKEVLTEVIAENRNVPTLTAVSEHYSFSISKIDNGFLIESYGARGQIRKYAETKEKAFELTKELSE